MDLEDPPAPEPGTGDDLVAALTRHLAEHRADAAVAARARERWLRQAADEEALLAGVLLDLAERGDTVTVQGPGGRIHRGRVRAVGEDFVALRTGAGDVLLAHAAVAVVRPEGRPVAGADRAPALDLALAEALSVVAGDRPRVLVVNGDGTGRAGTLQAAGRDVLTLRLDDGTPAYVPLASVGEVVLTR